MTRARQLRVPFGWRRRGWWGENKRKMKNSRINGKNAFPLMRDDYTRAYRGSASISAASQGSRRSCSETTNNHVERNPWMTGALATQDWPMKIIDSQIHAWYPDTAERPWVPNALQPHLPEFPIEKVLETINAAGVHRAIIVPVSCTGFDNEYSLAAARALPDRLAVMGRFDIDASDAREQLAGWLDRPGMLGIRHFFSGEPWMSLLTEERYAWFWKDAEELQVPIMCLVPGNMKALHPIMERHPELRLIIDHAGRHPRGPKDEAAWSDLDQTLHLASFKNTSIKVSSLPSFSSTPYPYPSLHRPIKTIYDTFGPERMMWGSDVTRLDWGYEDNLRLFTEALEFLSAEDQEWILSKAAAKHCGWAL